MLRDIIERTDPSHEDRGGLSEHDTRTRGWPRSHSAYRALPNHSVYHSGPSAGDN